MLVRITRLTCKNANSRVSNEMAFGRLPFYSPTQSGLTAMSHPRISSDPDIMVGKPCIKGTRITVELILRELGAGHSFADVLDAYPHLTEDDLRAALAFAADYMQHETVLPV
jgi:uncharacterized protein (DUF433 family)